MCYLFQFETLNEIREKTDETCLRIHQPLSVAIKKTSSV